MPYKGTITDWRNDKGFGFIQGNHSSDKIFVHIKDIQPQHSTPSIGQEIIYELGKDKTGRICATKAALQGKHSSQKHQSSSSKAIGVLPLFLIGAFVFPLVGLVVFEKLPQVVLLYLVFINMFSYIVYLQDKLASATNQWRITENKLLFLALLGGWPGSIVAQKRLHHKVSKKSFLVLFRVAVFLNILLVIFVIPASRHFVLNIQDILPTLRHYF